MGEGIQALFCADLTGDVQRITAPDWNFDFFSPFAILEKETAWSCSPPTTASSSPPNWCERQIPAKSLPSSQITDENKHILDQLAPVTDESVIVKTVDGKDMLCWVLYPPQFDPSKQYPAIEIVLGGPQGSNSQDWSYRWCYRLMAQQGYIVILPNRRGTTAFGQAWKEQISGDYPGLNMQDYLSAGRYIKSQPYVSKLACVGASYGGYSAYMLEGLHGDLFDCFIAHAGIFDEKQLWYTTEEMWFANWDNGGLTEYAYTPGEMGPCRRRHHLRRHAAGRRPLRLHGQGAAPLCQLPFFHGHQVAHPDPLHPRHDGLPHPLRAGHGRLQRRPDDGRSLQAGRLPGREPLDPPAAERPLLAPHLLRLAGPLDEINRFNS